MSIYLCWTINVNLFVTVFQRWIRARPDYHYSLVINGLASVSEKDAKMTKKGKNSGGTGKVAFFLLFIKPTYDDAAELLESKQSAGKSSWHYFSDCYLFTHNRPFIHYNVVQSGFLILIQSSGWMQSCFGQTNGEPAEDRTVQETAVELLCGRRLRTWPILRAVRQRTGECRLPRFVACLYHIISFNIVHVNCFLR